MEEARKGLEELGGRDFEVCGVATVPGEDMAFVSGDFITISVSLHRIGPPYSTLSSNRVNKNLNLNLIAPSTLQIQLFPCSLDIDFENVLVGSADGDGVERKDFALDGDDGVVFVGEGGQGGDVET